MQITLKMPAVQSCAASRCAYNDSGSCHARAITVGDGNGVHAACDTYLVDELHSPSRTEDAGVGACKIAGCVHNQDLECEAPAIQLQMHKGHVDCGTYATA